MGAPCFCLCLFLQNPHCVQNSDDRDTHITEHGFPHTGHAECAQNKEHALDAKSNHDVLHHNPFRSLCNINGFYKFRWFICHQNNIRSFNRGIRAKTSHGNADICTGKNRGIVDAIAHEGEFAALPFLLIQHFQLFDLLVGQELCIIRIQTKFVCHRLADSLIIAGKHNSFFHADLFQLCDCALAVRLHFICDQDNKGPEAWEQDKAEREMVLTEFIPYLKQHCNLSAMERAATAALREGQDISPERTAYYNAIVTYVQDCRPLLNQGQYDLPEPPKLADFDQTLQDYKAQVQTEIKQEAAAAGMTVEEYAAAGFESPQQGSFSIYQLRNEDSTRDYRFEPYDRLQAAGRTVDKANYMEVYAAPLTAGTTLEDIYRTFNVDHPADFKGHSLSVSDVVVLHQNGQDTAHYCDSVGFQQVPEFLQENPLRTAELSTEQNENMIDGVLNNAPSLGKLEAKAKAGEQISLTDLAAAVKAEEKAPKAKKSRTAKSKKPSIRAQLDAAKKEQSKQTLPREKAKELEV